MDNDNVHSYSSSILNSCNVHKEVLLDHKIIIYCINFEDFNDVDNNEVHYENFLNVDVYHNGGDNIYFRGNILNFQDEEKEGITWIRIYVINFIDNVHLLGMGDGIDGGIDYLVVIFDNVDYKDMVYVYDEIIDQVGIDVGSMVVHYVDFHKNSNVSMKVPLINKVIIMVIGILNYFYRIVRDIHFDNIVHIYHILIKEH